MHRFHGTGQFDVESLRRAIALLNLALILIFSAIIYAYYLVYGALYYQAGIAFAAWCLFVQHSIRNRILSQRAVARRAAVGNIAWAIFGTSVIASQMIVPIMQFVDAKWL